LTLDALARTACERGRRRACGAQALELSIPAKTGYAIARAPAAIVLLDLKMPKVDGIEVLRQVKADPVLKTITVVRPPPRRAKNRLVRTYDLGVNASS